MPIIYPSVISIRSKPRTCRNPVWNQDVWEFKRRKDMYLILFIDDRQLSIDTRSERVDLLRIIRMSRVQVARTRSFPLEG
jgi:hypothetical protein